MANEPSDENVVYVRAPEVVGSVLAGLANQGFEIKKRREVTEREELTPPERLEHQLEVVRSVLRQMGATFIPTSNLFRYKGAEYTPDSMSSRIYASMSKKQGWSKDTAKSALEVFINDQRKVLVEEAKRQVMDFDPSIGDVYLKRFVGLMTDVSVEEVNPLHVAAVHSMIWQVKRKFNGQFLNERPLMVIFAGGQEFGKSWTLQKFFAPIEEWVGPPCRLRIINDRFSVDIFNKYYVIPFEDLHRDIQGVELGLFKSLITEATFPYRAPRDKFNLKLDNIATCYATTNFTTRDLLPDDSGARRWWEIVSPNRPWNDGDSAKLKEIDFYALWRSVDGRTDKSPRRELLEQFRMVQNTKLRHTSPLEEFFNEEIEITGNLEHRLTQAQLYDHVRTWFDEQGSKPPMKKAVKDLALRLGIEIDTSGTRPVFCGLKKLAN